MTFSTILKVKYSNDCLGFPAQLHRSSGPVLLKVLCKALILKSVFCCAYDYMNLYVCLCSCVCPRVGVHLKVYTRYVCEC